MWFRDSHIKSIRILAILSLAIVAIVIISCSIQKKSLTTVEVIAPKAKECSKCHIDIYDEWIKSKHSTAYTNDSFRLQTFDYQVEACLPCHIPLTALEPDKPIEARQVYREEGVTCISCHLLEGEQHGPFIAGAIMPHASKQEPDLYFNAALCGTCHSGTYQSWLKVHETDPEIKVCQQCHMGEVRRKMTQPTGPLSTAIVALHKKHDLRRHTFDASVLPDEESVEIKIITQSSESDTAAYRISVRNLLPHAIPTGDFGFRKVTLGAELINSMGEVTTSVNRDLYKDLDTHLKPGETIELILPVQNGENVGSQTGAIGTIHVFLKRVLADGSDSFSIADLTLALAEGGVNP